MATNKVNAVPMPSAHPPENQSAVPPSPLTAVRHPVTCGTSPGLYWKEVLVDDQGHTGEGCPHLELKGSENTTITLMEYR